MNGMTPNASKAARFLASMPSGITTLEKQDAKSLLLETDGMLMACGYLYDIKANDIGCDVFRITLQRKN